MGILSMLGFGSRKADKPEPGLVSPLREQALRAVETKEWPLAETLFRQALEETASPLYRLMLLLDLERVLREQGKLAAARAVAHHAVQSCANLQNRRLTSEALEALATNELDLGDTSSAQAHFTEAVDSIPGSSAQDLARKSRILRKQGVAFMRSGSLGEAQQTLERSLKLVEKAFGHAHVETAHVLSEIGRLHSEAGNHEIAHSILRNALELYREVAGPDSAEASRGLHNLAMSLDAAGQIDLATDEYERALSERERHLGTSVEVTAEIKSGLALLYINAGKIAPARELLSHAIGVLERAGGQRFVVALEALAIADEISGRHSDAQRYREKLARLKAVREAVPVL